MPRIFTEEFKKDAVALVESGISQKQVAADLGVSKTALQTWVRDARYQSHGMAPPLMLTSAKKCPKLSNASWSSKWRTKCCARPQPTSPSRIFVPQNNGPARPRISRQNR